MGQVRRVRSPVQEFPIVVHDRSPYALDTSELGRRPGTMREESFVVPAPKDLGAGVIAVPPGADLALEVRFEAVLEGVLVTGVVQGQALGECVRCLDPIDQEVDVRFQELFVYPEKRQTYEDESEEVIFELKDDLADIEPVIRDAVVPVLPFQPVCRVDCLGLCSECGAQLNDDPDHQHDKVDPRWASLTSLLDETKES